MSLPKEYKQWVTTQSGLDSLSMTTATLPEPGEDEVLVKIRTVSLNYRDTEVCMGLYGHHASISQSSSSPPLVPCSDMCGTIISSNSSTWKAGTRVLSTFNQSHLTGQITSTDMASGLGLPLPGVLAEYRVFPALGLVACPEYLTDEEACTLSIAAVTAWMSINWQQSNGSPLRSMSGGEPPVVLLQGTGGVAIAGLQIATALGLQTIVTSSSDEKLTRAKEMGATHTINYKTNPSWDEQVLKLTSDRGANIILETGGASTLRKSFACIAFGGCISCIGYLGGKEDEAGSKQTNINVLALMKNVTLHGILNGPRDRFEEMLRVYEKEGIRPVVDEVFAFEEAKEALEYLYGGKHFGKVVIKVA